MLTLATCLRIRPVLLSTSIQVQLGESALCHLELTEADSWRMWITRFEQAPFKFTAEYVEVLNGCGSQCYEYFANLFVDGFLAARQHCERILSLVQCIEGLSVAETCSRFRPTQRTNKSAKELHSQQVPTCPVWETVKRASQITCAKSFAWVKVMSSAGE